MTSTIQHLDNREALMTLLTAPGRYPIEVRDDSLTGIGIYRGDTLVIQSQRHACNGDMVIAMIDNHDVTVKRIQFSGCNHIKLVTHQQDQECVTLGIERVEIQGKVIGQIRRYQ